MKILIRRLIIACFFVLITNASFSQQTNIDSLKYELKVTKDDSIRIAILNTIATKYQSINTDSALSYGNRMLQSSLKIAHKYNIAKAYNSIGVSYYYKSDLNSAIDSWKKSILICKETDDKEALSKTYMNIGIIYYSRGEFDDAIQQFLLSLENFTNIDNKKGMADCYSNIGIIQMYRGEYSKSIENLRSADEYYKAVEFLAGLAACNLNLGTVYMYQGSYAKAVKSINKSISAYQKLEMNLDLARSYSNIGSVYQLQGVQYKAFNKNPDSLFALAIINYDKSLELSIDLKDKKQQSICLSNIGGIYYEENNLLEAGNHFQAALELAEQLEDKLGMATLYQNIAALHVSWANISDNNNNVKQAKLDSAIILSNRALEIKKELSIRSFYESIIQSMANWSLGNFTLAYENFNKTIELDNENILMNFSFISEKEKENFFETIKEHYWQYNSFALQNTDSFPMITETVFNNTIKNKGLLLKSNTAMHNAIRSSNDTTLIDKYENWIAMKRQIVKQYTNGEDASILEYKADSIEGFLIKNSNEFSDFYRVQNISWKQIQAKLGKDEAAIEFLHFQLMDPDSSLIDFTNQTEYVALIITPTSKYPSMIPLFKKKQLEEIIGKFSGNNYSYINSIYGKNDEINTRLYDLIWKPMEEHLKGVRKVFLSPDGLLHKISFPAIAKEQDVYLCDAYDIEVKSSTGAIAGSSDENGIFEFSQNTTATLFGGINYDTDSTTYKGWTYLEGTKIETKKIDKILNNANVEVNYFKGVNATEEEFKLLASNSNILHISTHGFFYPDPKELKKETEKEVEYEGVVFRGGNRGFGVESFVENRNPLMRSGLVFAGANDVWSKQNNNDSIDDGVLTAQEVSNIDMRKTELVVMSACETGLGEIKGSEGVYGLQRAFKMAGVNYMIMSLWQVPDKETEEFMTTFYKKLIKQNNIKIAFAETQKEMRQKYDPYFWAAFVLVE